ncbi:MAG: 2-amino-4-hydroxy-6-hydroxymethyldihydropteridine diphosphokinase, partial [Gammaproteobacteria bacterium]|nr:2-amino-4-hydroxy-6-hydroxymethyldihydropteridine diphosphokinase [Gammaproteobacteria bacterium]
MRSDWWLPAYIAIGSNIDDPKTQVSLAVTELGTLRETRRVQVSRFYSSPPLGPPDQPDYVNAVAALLTRQEPTGLLAELLRIEARMGRQRGAEKWGPRRIDLDLLMHGDNVM